MQTVAEILEQKGYETHTVEVNTAVADAVARMNALGIGSLVVVDSDSVAGIFTERDVLVRIVAAGRAPDSTRVGEVMTRDLITVSPETGIDRAMAIVSERRARHLPVSRHGTLCGMVSAGDITKWLVSQREAQISDLLLYITRG